MTCWHCCRQHSSWCKPNTINWMLRCVGRDCKVGNMLGVPCTVHAEVRSCRTSDKCHLKLVRLRFFLRGSNLCAFIQRIYAMCGFPFSLTVNTRSYNNESFVWWVHYIKESKLRFAHCHRNPISFIPIYLDGGGTFFNSLSPPSHIFYARTRLSSFNHITPQLEHSSELKASMTFHFHFINHKCVEAHI